MTIDPRLKERRRDVAEDRAKRNVGRLLRFLAVIMTVGFGVWLMYSPWLSVSRVAVTGVEQSDANRTLVTRGVVAGTPMFKIDSRSVTDQLLADPWIATATVSKDWPDEVHIVIVERTPIAWSRTSEGWTRRAIDGKAVPSSSEPDPEMAHIDLPQLSALESVDSSFMLGALKFIDALDPVWHPGAVLNVADTELWAIVGGYQVRLGRPVEMAEKARSLAALLTRDLADGSVIVLIAPTNPAVMAPGAPDERESEDESESGE